MQPLTFEEFEAPAPKRQPTLKEQGTKSQISQRAAATEDSRVSTEETRTLLPFKAREAEAKADQADIKTEADKVALQGEKLALEKALKLSAGVPPPEKMAEARTILLNEIRNLSQARDLSENGFFATGIGYSTAREFAGSPAASIDALLAPVLANSAFKALNEMRAASPTGGALGNVTERELDLLMASEGFISPKSDDALFQQGVNDLIRRRLEVLARMGANPEEIASAIGPQYFEEFAPDIKAYRFSKADEEQLDDYVKTSMADGTFDPTDFAALMGRAYYKATGREPDQAYVTGAMRTGEQLLSTGKTSLGGMAYGPIDKQAREAYLTLNPEGLGRELGTGEVIGGAVVNFVPSAFELGYDTVRALTIDAPQTIEGVVDIVAGATGLSDDDTAWEAVKDYYTERYGTMRGFKKALRDDPAAIAADVAGIFTGGATIAAKTAGTLGKVSKIAALSDAARKAEGFGAIAAKLDPVAGAANAVGKGFDLATEAGKRTTGALAGVQPDNLSQAFSAGERGSQGFLDNLEGNEPQSAAVAKMDAAIGELYADRSSQYVREMDRLKQNPETLSFDAVDTAIDDVREIGRYGDIDISSAADVWSQVNAKVDEFRAAGDTSVVSFDAMKRAVGNIRDNYQKGTPQYRVANDVAKSIDRTITRKAPVYSKIMRDYRQASDTLSDVKATLSSDAKSMDTTLRKLQKATTGSGPRGTSVMDLLESTNAGKGLSDMVAGQNLSSTEGSRLANLALGTGAVAGGAPELLAGSFMSPQRAGKGAYRAGQLKSAVTRNAPAQTLGRLVERYGDAGAQALRMGNPPLIQSQINEFEAPMTDEEREQLLQAYEAMGGYEALPVQPSSLSREGAGDVDVEALRERYSSPEADMQPVDDLGRNVEGIGGPAEEPMMLGGRPTEVDPTTGERFFLDTGEVVRGYRDGGAVESEDYEPAWYDRARSAAKGALFAYGDEAEAAARSLLAGDFAMKKYDDRAAKIREEMARYETARPLESLAWEAGGALAPALVPGGQGVAGARTAALLAKYGTKGKVAKEAAEVLAQSALYGSGAADSMSDIPQSVRDEMLMGGAMYGGGKAAAVPLKKGYRKLRGRKKRNR